MHGIQRECAGKFAAWHILKNKPGTNNETRILDATELRLFGCLTESTRTHKFKSNILTLNTKLKPYSHVMSGTVFFFCSKSAFLAQQAAPERCRKECNKEQDKKELWHSRSRRWTWFRVLWQAAPSSSASSRSGDTQSTRSTRFESQQHSLCMETCRWSSNHNDAASSSQVWLTDAKLRERARKLAAVDTSRGQRFPESARKRAAQNLDIIDEASTKWRPPRSGRTVSAYLVLTYHTLRTSTRIWDDNSNASRKTKRKISIRIRWYGTVYVGHPASRNFFLRQRLFGEFRFNQKSDTKNNETIVQCNKEVGQWTEKFTECFLIGKTHLGKGRLCWTTEQFSCQQRKSTYSPIQFCASGEFMILTQAHGRRKLIGLWFRSGVENWIEVTGEQREFERKNFQGFTTLQILDTIRNMMTEIQREPEQFQGRIIFMSMYNDTGWEQNGNEEKCIANFF